MILDIEDKEINIGDECIFSSPGWYGIKKIMITKLTAGRVYYKAQRPDKTYGHCSEYFVNKSSNYCEFYKL